VLDQGIKKSHLKWSTATQSGQGCSPVLHESIKYGPTT